MEPTSNEKDFADTPSGWHERWKMELDAARRELERWLKQGEKIVKRFLDERESRSSNNPNGDTRWNFFTANVQTQRALLYGKTPSVTARRRFEDANDDDARVAGELLERMLNSDIERDTDSYSVSLEYALLDRLLAGLGNVRVRYVCEFETVQTPAKLHPETGEELAPAVEEERKSFEDAEVEYAHWQDQLWSPSRTFHDSRWWAFRAQMSRTQLVKRFGDKLGKAIPLNAKRSKRSGRHSMDPTTVDPWGRAEIWEIWDKEHREVFWYCDGYPAILDRQEDPLELDGFWPFPRPMFANLTTSTLIPRPDFVLVQDLYDEIDTVSTRITLLERGIALKGVYDKTAVGVQRLINEAQQNELIPIENWPRFKEKGGIEGAIEWLPLDALVNALDKLREYRKELIGAVDQLSGYNDLMRGESSEVAETATAQSIKSKFASVRLQALQDEFARFASDVQKIRAEIISKHFDASTILERSNAQYTFDAAVAGRAVQLLKDRFASYRVEVKPESVSMQDFAALKAERTEWLTAAGAFISNAQGFTQAMPQAQPFVMQLLKWTMAGLRGSSEVEGILDQAINTAQQAAANPQPQQNPAAADMAKVQAQAEAKKQELLLKDQLDQKRLARETQADRERDEAEARQHDQEQQVAHELSMRENVQRAQLDIEKAKALQAVKPPPVIRPPGGVKP